MNQISGRGAGQTWVEIETCTYTHETLGWVRAHVWVKIFTRTRTRQVELLVGSGTHWVLGLRVKLASLALIVDCPLHHEKHLVGIEQKL